MINALTVVMSHCQGDPRNQFLSQLSSVSFLDETAEIYEELYLFQY